MANVIKLRKGLDINLKGKPVSEISDVKQAETYALVPDDFTGVTPKVVVRENDVVKAGDALFRVSASKLVEKGFYSVIKVLSAKEEITGNLPSLKTGEILEAAHEFYPEQHFTQGPARYTDASIVRMLEEKGIGRPSTYAPIISVLLDRYYVVRNNRQLMPTILGKMINKILVESFPDVINEKFTAEVENELDDVEQNKVVWNDMIRNFYGGFIKRCGEVEKSVASVKGFLDEN